MTAPYQLLAVKKVHEGHHSDTVVLVVCPLTSIIQDQVKEGNSLGLDCAALKDCKDLSSVVSGTTRVVFASAEEVLHNDFQRILKNRNSKFHEALELLVVDESHTVETWTGKRSSKKEKSFRSAYGELSTLRSLCKEGTPVLALTGTADEKTKEVITTQLVLRPNTCHIFISPNRLNIRISVIKTNKKEAFSKLDWLIDLCKNKGLDTPKSILFCNTMKDVATVVNHIMWKLGDLAFYPKTSRKSEDCILGIYHSLSWDSYKERLVSDLKCNGKKRLVVATTALSMGVNFPDIRYIINWGPARNLLDHHQEAGRAGRDHKQSDVIIIYHGQQLTHCEDEVKEFVRCTSCLRVASYKALDHGIKPLEPKHDCCSYCRPLCRCQGSACGSDKLPFENGNENEFICEQHCVRSVSAEDKSTLYSALLEIRESECSSGGVLFDKAESHGFSVELCQDIVNGSPKIFKVEDLMNSYPIFTVAHAVKILEVFQELFDDIEESSASTSYNLSSHLLSNQDDVHEYYGYFDFLPESDSELHFQLFPDCDD